MKAKIVITMAEDGESYEYKLGGKAIDITSLLLAVIDQEPFFATAAIAAVETYLRRDENKENPLAAAFHTNRKN